MATTCFGSIKARHMRVTRLDSCGLPVVGSSSVVVSDGFVKVDVSPQYEDGETFRVKNADGVYVINEWDDPSLMQVDLTSEFAKVDPNMVEIITGSRLVLDGADSVGMAFSEGQVTNRFALETWSRMPGQACDENGDPLWIYWLWGHVGNGRIGDLTLENGAASFTLSGSTRAIPATIWVGGTDADPDPPLDASPFAVSHLPFGEEIEAGEHWYFGTTTVAPPAASCGVSALAAYPPNPTP